jgi:hypothetical protein
MSAVEIEQAISEMAEQPFDAAEILLSKIFGELSCQISKQIYDPFYTDQVKN